MSALMAMCRKSDAESASVQHIMLMFFVVGCGLVFICAWQDFSGEHVYVMYVMLHVCISNSASKRGCCRNAMISQNIVVTVLVRSTHIEKSAMSHPRRIRPKCHVTTYTSAFQHEHPSPPYPTWLFCTFYMAALSQMNLYMPFLCLHKRIDNFLYVFSHNFCYVYANIIDS